ncbi:MAG: hypothetical protein A2177_04150 [Spirochaetes bacterium RBG_13_68_11]|nr:MAG: hypothetical protein A2177_04150 [Spirochaetes bacterium RBG_13_68_11]
MERNPGRGRQTANAAAPAAPDALGAIIERYRARPAAIIGLLQDVHRQFGYLPEEALERVARELDIPLSRLFSLATFYTSFRLTPTGRHRVCVCVGTACHVKGAARIVDALQRDLQVGPGETTADGEFTLETVNCLGACALAPLVVVDDEYHGRMDPKKASRIAQASAEAATKCTDGGAVPAA